MSFIREIPSSFHLWEVEPINDIVIQPILDVINPLSGFEGTKSGSVKFLIPGNDTFVDLRKSYIELVLKLTGSGTIPAAGQTAAKNINVKFDKIADSKLSVVNNIAHSMFAYVRERLGNQNISLGTGNQGFLTEIQLLSNTTKEAQETYFQVTGWLKDVAGEMDSGIDPAAPLTSRNHAQYLRRKNFFDHETGVGHFRMRPHTGLSFMKKNIIPYLDIEVELVRHNNSDFYCKAALPKTFDIEIVRARYHVQRYKCSPTYVAGVEQMLKEHPVIYRINDAHLNTCTIPQGVSNYSNDNLFHGNVPRRIIFAFVSTAAFNGHHEKNPFNFQHFTIQSFRLLKNGVDYPYPETITDFKSVPPAFLDAYHQMMMNMNADYNDHVVSLTPQEYANGYLMFSYNMSPDQESGTDLLNLANRPSQIRAEVRFADALTESIQMLVYYESPTTISIDFARRVVVSHN